MKLTTRLALTICVLTIVGSMLINSSEVRTNINRTTQFIEFKVDILRQLGMVR